MKIVSFLVVYLQQQCIFIEKNSNLRRLFVRIYRMTYRLYVDINKLCDFYIKRTNMR